MGGLFRAPKPVEPPPAAAAAPAVAVPEPVQPVAAAGGETDDDRARRVAALEARRRGLSGTVATSWRGVLADALPPVGRKSLLGE